MKIAIVDKFCNVNYNFSKNLVEYLQLKGHEVEHSPIFKPHFNEFDILHFDWADEVTEKGLFQSASFVGNPRITVRLHAYEAHDGFAKKIPWHSVDTVIFVSDHYKQIFEKLDLKSIPKETVVVWHGIDHNKFNFIQHTGKNFLYVGNVNIWKGAQLLAQVALAYPDREVHIYGRGGKPQCSRSQIYYEHLNLPNIKFHEFREDICNVMKDPQYEFILSTSIGESFHLAVAEGMACGLKPLVHDWFGAKQLWGNTWRSIDDLKKMVDDKETSAKEASDYIFTNYNFERQLDKLTAVILGSEQIDESESGDSDKEKSDPPPRLKPDSDSTIAACMVVSHYKGLERALKSCHEYIDAAYLAVDDRNEPDLLKRVNDLLAELSLNGKAERFDPPDPWDFSFARNIAHNMNDCDWSFVLDDDEYVLKPDEIRAVLQAHEKDDAVEITCGMGDDGYGNIGYTWNSARILRQKVRWKNARHNIPDPAMIKTQSRWNGDIIVVDDKSIKATDRRTARSIQRNTNIEVFRKKVGENANDTRSMFYLAVAYREGGQHWEAINWYKQYLATGGWDEERWQACYDMATCQMYLKRWTEARESLHQAIKEKADRAEAFILMGDIAYTCRDFTNAVVWYELGCAIPVPSNARLFVRRSIYDWERYDKLSMAYSHLENWQASINCAMKALLKRPGDRRIKNNVEIWSTKLLEETDTKTQQKEERV